MRQERWSVAIGVGCDHMGRTNPGGYGKHSHEVIHRQSNTAPYALHFRGTWAGKIKFLQESAQHTYSDLALLSAVPDCFE
jgi:hypothetical protein